MNCITELIPSGGKGTSVSYGLRAALGGGGKSAWEGVSSQLSAGVGPALWRCKGGLGGALAVPTPPSLGDFFGMYSKK